MLVWLAMGATVTRSLRRVSSLLIPLGGRPGPRHGEEAIPCAARSVTPPAIPSETRLG
jgi:hypothetical protein